jgi:hypothetical protein
VVWSYGFGGKPFHRRIAQHGMTAEPPEPAQEDDRWYPGCMSAGERTEVEELARIFEAARVGTDADHPFASTVIPPRRADGVIAGFSWVRYALPVDGFWDLIARLGLAAAPFDWPEWASQLRSSGNDLLDPELVASLAPPDLRRCLTMLQRAERFTDGTWASALNRGVFDALLAKIIALDEEGQLGLGQPLL